MRFPRRCLVGFVCLLLLLTPKATKADSLHNAVVAVFVGVIVGTAAITVAIVLVVRHKPSITGCAMGDASGYTLKSEGDGKTYVLRGDLAALAEGRRVRVIGSKQDRDGAKEFTVKRVTKNFGPCSATSSPS